MSSAPSTQSSSTTVVISDARYVNPDTGEVFTSTKYHMLGTGCLDDSPHRLEVSEDVALAFGRSLCGTCINVEKRRRAQEVIAGILDDMFEEGSVFEQIAQRLPVNIEMRLLWHDPDKKQPRVVWTSHDDG